MRWGARSRSNFSISFNSRNLHPGHFHPLPIVSGTALSQSVCIFHLIFLLQMWIGPIGAQWWQHAAPSHLLRLYRNNSCRYPRMPEALRDDAHPINCLQLVSRWYYHGIITPQCIHIQSYHIDLDISILSMRTFIIIYLCIHFRIKYLPYISFSNAYLPGLLINRSFIHLILRPFWLLFHDTWIAEKLSSSQTPSTLHWICLAA